MFVLNVEILYKNVICEIYQNFIINNYIYLYDWCVFCLFLVKQLLTHKILKGEKI